MCASIRCKISLGLNYTWNYLASTPSKQNIFEQQLLRLWATYQKSNLTTCKERPRAIQNCAVYFCTPNTKLKISLTNCVPNSQLSSVLRLTWRACGTKTVKLISRHTKTFETMWQLKYLIECFCGQVVKSDSVKAVTINLAVTSLRYGRPSCRLTTCSALRERFWINSWFLN